MFDVDTVRSQFPALSIAAIFLDAPGGTQIAQPSLNRIQNYLLESNANHEGVFATSRLSDAILEQAHEGMADLLNARSWQEVIFGANMTTLTLHISRSIAREWGPGDTIVVTRLDHDANIMPWVLAAEDRGVRVRWVDFHPEDGTLDLDDLQRALEEKPRLVAVGYASNALGTINPIAQITRWVHEAGALVYVDAVQYAPHGPIDVQALDCDFLVCSSYKFFGPHQGILYGKMEHLQRLKAYKVRPASDEPPGKFETGTQNHEAMAGVLGVIEYLEWLGEYYGSEFSTQFGGAYAGRRLKLKQALTAVCSYEFELARLLLDILEETPGVTIYGLRDRGRLAERVPTVSFTLQGWHPRQVAIELDKAGVHVWDGNYYALAVTERLGLEDKGGMVRVGPVHYNTLQEIHQLGEALGRIAAG